MFSEECPPYSQPGSVLFSQPSEVDSWCQSIGFPLTPPDTASECSTSDCADMNVPSWSQASLPAESWNTAPAPDHSTMMQAPGSNWSSRGHPVTAQDLQALDASSWLNVPHGSVDSGLSPVLSQESQSTHTLNTISEPEVPLLPPGLDLSFISEPSWDFSGPVVYSSSHVAQECSPGFVPSPECGQYPGYAAPQPVVYGPQQPMYLFQGQAPCPKRSASDPSMTQRRPLLPRTETQTIQSGHAHGPQYAVRQPHTGLVRADSAASVSSSQGPIQDTVMPAALSCQPQGPAVPFSRMSPPGRTVVSPRPDTAPPSKLVSDPSAEDFGSLIQYDQDEKTASAPPRSAPPHFMILISGTDVHLAMLQPTPLRHRRQEALLTPSFSPGIRPLPPPVRPMRDVTGAIHCTMRDPPPMDSTTARSRATPAADTSPPSSSATTSMIARPSVFYTNPPVGISR